MAVATGLNETHVRKPLRHAITQLILHEPRPGAVAHTAASRLLVEDKGLYNWLRFSTDDLWHAAYHTGHAINVSHFFSGTPTAQNASQSQCSFPRKAWSVALPHGQQLPLERA
ncbi:hypothetical protein F5Y05DRAFT_407642 [Hypoxylon sp. FL0543]|nr:hypothetical protein F5Y05DRAFT_407642 [Hypoxylon sp. FL0543]